MIFFIRRNYQTNMQCMQQKRISLSDNVNKWGVQKCNRVTEMAQKSTVERASSSWRQQNYNYTLRQRRHRRDNYLYNFAAFSKATLFVKILPTLISNSVTFMGLNLKLPTTAIKSIQSCYHFVFYKAATAIKRPEQTVTIAMKIKLFSRLYYTKNSLK